MDGLWQMVSLAPGNVAREALLGGAFMVLVCFVADVTDQLLTAWRS
jgi:hypothetical protein